MDEKDINSPQENTTYTPPQENPPSQEQDPRSRYIQGMSMPPPYGSRPTPPPPYDQGGSTPNNFGARPQQPYNNFGTGQIPPPNQYGSFGNNAPRQPRYDAFMYEPIGFEELERRQAEQAAAAEVKKKTPGVKAAIILFVVLVVGAFLLGIYGIVYDIMNSKESIDKLVEAKQVVFYRESKPKGANDPENFKDENGKYTPEGAAIAVRPSIVEIYTYEDANAYKKDIYLGTGSGIVISDDGYIVTNAHVLKENGYHIISTVDGDKYPAKVVGRDVKTDIAVIKVDTDKLTPATLGNSDEAIVGETVIAIGNPANLSSTVTDGIVSAVSRKIRSDSTGFEMDCIQTNADISPGNSGGALVNMYGQVIGITSSKYVSSSFEGLGFAISINEALPIIEELIKNGHIGGRFRIGITLVDMSDASKLKIIEEKLGFPLPEDFEGIYIDSISEDSDIKNTALKVGDFITKVDGTPIKTYNEFYDTISSKYGAGDTVPATCAHIDKDGKISYYDIKFKLIEDTSGNY